MFEVTICDFSESGMRQICWHFKGGRQETALQSLSRHMRKIASIKKVHASVMKMRMKIVFMFVDL